MIPIKAKKYSYKLYFILPLTIVIIRSRSLFNIIRSASLPASILPLYLSTLAIILGLTFCSFYIKRDELEILDYYFSDNYSDVFRDYPWVSGINPFKGKVRNERGGTRKHQFFKRKDRGPF